ncbi:hypothetical protein JCM16303_003635 [Sporobolomyces ruberrimus]
MSIDLSSRRGSAASSITIQVSTSTASSLPTFDISDERIAPLPTFETSTTIEPFPLAQADQSRPPSPPPFPEAPSTSNEETVNLEAAGPESSPPPPPYQFPGPPPPLSSSSINPLSFYTYPFSTLTPVTSTFLPQHSSLLENESSLPPPPPPEYNEVPQTLAERCFVFGFLCPFLWIIGITKYWYSERPVGFAEKNQRHKEDEGDLESGVAVPSEEMERIEESLDNWREEEKLWSLRCAWCLGGVTSLGVLGGIIVAAVMGKS